MDKRLAVSLNGNRKVVGILRGFDQFVNLVLEETLEINANNEAVDCGTIVVRGNSVISMEALEPVTN